MGHPPLLIRRCGAAQRQAAIETLAAALADDPQLAWEFGGPDYEQRLRALIANDVEAGLAADELWAAGDLDAVAAWSGPRSGAERRALVEEWIADEDVEAADPAKHEAAAAWDRRLAAALPEDPAWYLEILGTRPAMQRRGYASALLRPALARCDREGLLAEAETATRDAVTFYESLGFVVEAEVTVAGVPPGWLLVRAPQS